MVAGLRMDPKDKCALFEGSKKALCVVINAALFFYLPSWVFGDDSFTPADPVWSHITITMLCELGTMDRLNEKILLRTAGTTIGALSGVLMTYRGLTDPVRLAILVVWITALGYMEKKDPSRSYIWTIGTVTFGICTYLGRAGKTVTPWKRWFSIMLGTLVTAFVQLLLPQLGIFPGNEVKDELINVAEAAWKGSVAMLEEAMQNPRDEEALKRVKTQQASVNAAFQRYPASWKMYSYARTMMMLFPKPLGLDSTKQLLDGPLFELFLSSCAAARLLYKTSPHPEASITYSTVRTGLNAVGTGVASSLRASAVAASDPSALASASVGLADAVDAAMTVEKQLDSIAKVHQPCLTTALSDMMAVIQHLSDALPIAEAGEEAAARVKASKVGCCDLLKALRCREGAIAEAATGKKFALHVPITMLGA